MKSSLARLGGSLKSKPMWRNTRGVFCHVGFFMHVSTVSSCHEVFVAWAVLMKERK
jgi:hypothetical protein